MFWLAVQQGDLKVEIMTASPNPDEKAKKILDAVRTLLAKNGYAATTISQVAAEAGVSRGLLHYYFKNKEEMLARVVQKNMEVSVDLVEALFAQSETPQDLAAEITSALRGIVESDPDFFNLFFEGWSVARQSPVVAQKLTSLYHQFREAIQGGLKEALTRGAISPAIQLDGLAALLTGIIDGIGLQMAAEPELAANEAIWEATETGIRVLLGGEL